MKELGVNFDFNNELEKQTYPYILKLIINKLELKLIYKTTMLST